MSESSQIESEKSLSSSTEAGGSLASDLNSEEHITISYNSGLLPMVGLMYLLFLGLLFIPLAMAPHPNHISPWFYLNMFGITSVAFLPMIYAVLKTYSIEISPRGIKFSDGFRTMAGRPERSWDDLHSIQLGHVGSAADSANAPMRWRGRYGLSMQTLTRGWSRLNFDFKSGGSSTIYLPYLRREQGEQLLRAIDRWSDSSRLAAPVVNLQRSLLLETDTLVSPTTIWQEDLSAQYVATNYVPLPSGHTLRDGQIKVLMELGAGGMAAVYLAEDKNRGKVVLKEAVAPLDVDESQREKARELFAREARLLEKLDHPRIAHVLDHFVERGRDYLMLEYIAGVTLRQTVNGGGPQKENTVVKWADQILEIVIYLHGQNPPIIHRDLTPDNLILARDGRVVLVDFGAANEFVGTATGTMIGKQCYIAPEQLRGKALPLSDIYALGGCLYYFLTGKDPVPLSPSDPKKTVDTTSDALARLVLSCTSFDTSGRPQSAQAVQAKLKELVGVK